MFPSGHGTGVRLRLAVIVACHGEHVLKLWQTRPSDHECPLCLLLCTCLISSSVFIAVSWCGGEEQKEVETFSLRIG